jgi:RimJ/RimL family protein N-acetyltransferase
MITVSGSGPLGEEGMNNSSETPLDLHATKFQLSRNGVQLRPFTDQELYSTNYLAWMNDPAMTWTIGRFDYLMPVTREKLVQYVHSLDLRSTMFLAIHLDGISGTSRFAGTFKIYDFDLLARRVSFGVMVGRDLWGQGIASAAIGAACDYVFDVLGFRKITAGFAAPNVGMERAFLKNGFQVEAVLKGQLFLAGDYVDHKLVCRFRSDSGK